EKGGDKTELVLKGLMGGNPFYQEMNTVTTQEMEVTGMKHKQEQKQTFWFKWTPKGDKSKDGDFTVEQEILDIKMDIDIGGNKISYDSTDKVQPKNPMSEFFKQLLGAKFTITIGPKDGVLTVKDVKGVDELIG